MERGPIGQTGRLRDQFAKRVMVRVQTELVQTLEPQSRIHHPTDEGGVACAGHGEGDEGDGFDIVVEETSKPFRLPD